MTQDSMKTVGILLGCFMFKRTYTAIFSCNPEWGPADSDSQMVTGRNACGLCLEICGGPMPKDHPTIEGGNSEQI
jgi:hypothetical protein